MTIRLTYFFAVIVFSINTGSGQSRVIDPLAKLIRNDKIDTNKIIHLNDLAWEIMFSDPDSAILIENDAISLAKKLGWKKGLANSYSQLGAFNYMKGDYVTALEAYFKALKIDESIKNEQGVAKRLVNIGIVYYRQGDHSKALSNYSKALKINIKLNNRNEIGLVYANMGIAYDNLGNYTKALSCFLKALPIKEELGSAKEVVTILSNIGLVYIYQGDSAIAKGNKAFATGLRYKQALEYFTKALVIEEPLGDKNGLAIILGNMGKLYLNYNDLAKAKTYLHKALDLYNEIGNKEGLKMVHQNLSDLQTLLSDPKGSLEHYKLYIAYRDSLQNEANTKKQTQLEMQYVFDKKQSADSIRNAERANLEEQKHQTEIKQQKIYTWGGVILFGIMLIVAVVSFRAFRNKQKANYIIAQQKHLVEEKQKEVLDSIHYAKRIQTALLPSEKYIERNLDKFKRN